MSSTIVLNQTNIVAQDNNVLEYSFPSSAKFDKHEICIESVSMYYSWQNVNANPLQNNKFQYQWYGSSGLTTHIITIPDGLYNLKDINALLQFEFIKNGHYLVTNSGQYHYFADIIVNSATYSFQINTYPLPTSSQFYDTSGDYVGYSIPTANAKTGASGWAGFHTDNFNPNIKMIPSGRFSELVGYADTFETGLNTGTATSKNTNLSFNSTTSPKITPNFNLFLAISNIDNVYSNPSTIIHSISPSVGFGMQIIDRPSEFAWNRLISGSYSKLRVQILGSDKQPIRILDPEMCIVLLIKSR